MSHVDLIYDILIQASSYRTRLLQVVDSSGGPLAFISPLGECGEIIVTKKLLGAAFIEAHHYLANYYKNGTELLRLDRSDLIRLYRSSVISLIVTAQDISALNIHWEALQMLGLEYLDTELVIIETMLTSRLARLNKSSLIWLLYQKTLCLRYRFLQDAYGRVVSCVFISADRHPRNYYAWNFLRGYVHVLQSSGASDGLASLYTRLNDYCHTNLADLSLWEVLLEIIVPLDLYREYSISQWQRHAQQSFGAYSLDIGEVSERVKSQWDFIIGTPIVNQTPWTFMRNMLKRLGSLEILTGFSEKCWTVLSEQADEAKVSFYKGKYSETMDASSMLLSEFERSSMARNKVRIVALHRAFG